MNLDQKLSEMAEKHSQKSIHIGFRNTAYFSYREGLKDALEFPEVQAPYIALESIVASHDENIKQGAIS